MSACRLSAATHVSKSKILTMLFPQFLAFGAFWNEILVGLGFSRANARVCILKNKAPVSDAHNALVLVVDMQRKLETVSELPSMEVMLPFSSSVLAV